MIYFYFADFRSEISQQQNRTAEESLEARNGVEHDASGLGAHVGRV